MITLTCRDTCRSCYIPEQFIHSMEELSEEINGRAYPYTRVYVRDEHAKHDYFVDVIESQKKINKLIDDIKTKSENRQRFVDKHIQETYKTRNVKK